MIYDINLTKLFTSITLMYSVFGLVVKDLKSYHVVT